MISFKNMAYFLTVPFTPNSGHNKKGLGAMATHSCPGVTGGGASSEKGSRWGRGWSTGVVRSS